MAEYIESEKGKPMLYLNGFLFVKDKGIRNKIYWKCQNFAKCCKCRAITIDDEVVSVSREHNHTGDPTVVEVRRLMHKIKADANSPRATGSLFTRESTDRPNSFLDSLMYVVYEMNTLASQINSNFQKFA